MFELLQNVHFVQTKQQLLDMNYGTVAMVVRALRQNVVSIRFYFYMS